MPAGRPPKYKTPEELQKKIDQYFEEEVGTEVISSADGKDQKVIPKPPTVSGMALYLGFMNRNSMYDYGDRGEFSGTIKRAIARVAAYAEKAILNGTGGAGAIFWLKNHGWKDQKTIDGKFETEDTGISRLNELLAKHAGSGSQGDDKGSGEE